MFSNKVSVTGRIRVVLSVSEWMLTPLNASWLFALVQSVLYEQDDNLQARFFKIITTWVCVCVCVFLF